jgi:hypothetical protein
MLAEMSSEEITEWKAYLSMKVAHVEEQQKEEAAHNRAKENNY